MAFFKWSDYELYYDWHETDLGKPTLIFIHDLGLNTEMWAQSLPFMDPEFNILIYDFYGHGKTGDRPATSLSMDLLERELLALIDQLGIKKAHLIGCRFSAIFALHLALRMPRRIESMTLMSLPFYAEPHSYDREAATIEQLITLDPRLFERKYIVDSLHPVTLRKSALILKSLRQVETGHIIETIHELVKKYNQSDFHLIDTLKRISVPVLFLHGEYDPVYPALLSMVFSNYVPNSRFMLVPGASSLIPLDHPNRFATLAARFILSDKTTSLPPARSRKIIRSFHNMIEKAYEPKKTLQRKLYMTVMSGDVRIIWNGRLLEGRWGQRHAWELLLFIALKHGAVKRDVLIDTLFPECNLAQARNHLRVRLSHLKKIFLTQPDESVHDVLIVSRDSVALNAEVKSDLGSYLESVDHLLWSDATPEDRSEAFLRLLADFAPEMREASDSAWYQGLVESIRTQLSQIMVQLLNGLSEEENPAALRRILVDGQKVEPYRGFCQEWRDSMKH